MTTVDMLEGLRAEISELTKNRLLKVRPDKEDQNPKLRTAKVYLMDLPTQEHGKVTKLSPYIVIQSQKTEDGQHEGGGVYSRRIVRVVFSVYDEDPEEGWLSLIGLMETVRIHILKRRTLADKYTLASNLRSEDELESLIETYMYTDADTGSYYVGEMAFTLDCPPIYREDTF